ncbi:DUF11 domain-containing protein [Chloroflexus sp. Y-396-1]|uniref:DUF11 domain-containing protein n=1 Tax=Chloroflexus sp. Y-396-1 TaxID=867845 RepID=UPI000490B765|nr:DUF11 domain-containing protein [Chloroflexus sp. Y-396-1]
MSSKPSPSAQFPSGRGREPAPWTIWELMAITVSILMIVVPLIVEGLNWIQPPVAPAQGLMEATGPTIELEQRPPTFTPVPTSTPTSGTATPDTPTPVTPTVDTPTPVTPTADTPTPVTSTPVTPTVDTPTPVTPTPVTPTAVTPTPITTTPIPTFTPSPTPGATRVTKVASLTTVSIGQDFSYSLSVTTQSDAPITLTLRDVLDSNLELLSVSAFGGTCFSGQTVLCTLNVSRFNPASVTLQVRVRPSASEGSNIPNQAVLEQGSQQVGVSNVVTVRVLGSVPPTAQITNTPTQVETDTPTPVTPIVVTVTPITTVTPVATNTPVASPVPSTPRPTSPPQPRPPEPPPPPTAPPPAPTEPPVVLPTEPPPPTPVVTVAPRPTTTPRPRPPASPTRTPTPEVSPTPTEPPAPAVFGESDLLLRLTSDWGSAYADQDIVFTIVLGNTHPTQMVSAVNVRSVMPSNLRILSASASRGTDPTINGQTVSYVAPDLAPGERVEINIATRIRPNVATGTLLVVQAQATYRELNRPVFSNISTVLVVGEQQAATATATLAPIISPTFTATTVTVTSTPTASAVPTATVTTGVVLGGGTSATATPSAASPVASGQTGGTAPLPNTSAGIPFLGVLLLGATLLTRTIRLHRARERI